ncbi:methyl-accepting chemotaxis protein [Cohnella luojiensis]|uniref:Methyl-accepting chemotaxis protein n=1 Tax=Cohnella luojiensis TaxID=652876 RepID=A0A4Y8M0Y8_9BACL|nr:methyl-accepting chemotaxis protein [Cohnella luojiensis]TFE28657.1 methyl-accepting chemotaxis protein [Cohnella luojiensis]
MIRQVGTGAEQVSKATEQIALTVHEAAEGSKKQVHSVDECAKAIHEVLSAVQHITASALFYLNLRM